MLTSLYYGHYDYWELRHKVTFDGINKLIWINDGVTELDMQIDVYSDWKEWMLLYDNTKYFSAFNTVGGEPTVAGQRLDVTYFLINGWKFKPYPGTYDLVIVGNVFDVDGGSIKVPADILENEPNNISISTNTSVIVRQIDSSGGDNTGSFDPDTIVSASLFGVQEESLYNIEGRVISIENMLSSVTQSIENTETYSSASNVMLVDLTQVNYSQSLQLSELYSLNISQSNQLYDQNLLIQSQSSQIVLQSELLVSQSVQLDSIETIIVSQSSTLDDVYTINVSQSVQLDTIEDSVDNIEFIINSQTGSSAITDEKVREIWELHGLDISKPLTVTQTKRLFGTVDQNVVTIGTGSAQTTTITRN